MRIDISPAINRLDYLPPDYLIDTIEIAFDLLPGSTRVSSQLSVRRRPHSSGTTLHLHGEQLALVSVRLNGKLLGKRDFRLDTKSLEILDMPEKAILQIETLTKPSKNTSLSGLYMSGGNFFTQCEAEGFRRITYFPDRPDVMAKFTVMLRADAQLYPVLLSNGNLIESGQLGDGRHFAKWEDPFPKPSYLFALVAGKLVCEEEHFRLGSGREVLLQIWVEDGNLDKTGHAMASLKKSIRWDEERFGLELDLDRFMIVAVSDFNMGAMENKGLNIFNTKFVLANPRTATDIDYANIESVVGHEYFHNWTGNRVTCRDWFQLSLKEGLTVFRDQEFSADMIDTASGRAVKRIEDVRLLRQIQFPEDAGPMAHPIRPDSYVEINNFYTVTVYEKGAEVVRMFQSLVGREGFRKGMDLYFSRYDGQAVTCDDFRLAMADANQRDFTQFERWYSQSGTPVVEAAGRYDAHQKTYTLNLRQRCEPSKDQPLKLPFHIPFTIALLNRDGKHIPLVLDTSSNDASGKGKQFELPDTLVLELIDEQQTFTFLNVSRAPVPSMLRNFSAPVLLEFDYTDADLAFLMAHDTDAFNRWEAAQRLLMQCLVSLATCYSTTVSSSINPTTARNIQTGTEDVANVALLSDNFRKVLEDPKIDPLFKEVIINLPSEAMIAEKMTDIDPAAIYNAVRQLRCHFAEKMKSVWEKCYADNQIDQPYDVDAVSTGKRALKNAALSCLAEIQNPQVQEMAKLQYQNADNMTDRLAGLAALRKSQSPYAAEALAKFYVDFKAEPLVIDKWFALQAGAPGMTIASIKALMRHPAFSLKNPNRARSVIFTFCNGNPSCFHAKDGSGYLFWAEQVVLLDTINPQVAARLARCLDRWPRYASAYRDKMHAALQRVAGTSRLSNDVREVIVKALSA